MKGLTTTQTSRLDNAVQPIINAVGRHVYQVGSVVRQEKRPRDVDVRCILDDDDFDARFPNEAWWSLVSYAVSRMLSEDTGLPIDFQFQRRTEANDLHDGPRSAVGLREGRFAAGGDATPSTRKEGWR